MACTALYFMSLRGDVLIARTYRDEADPALPAAFRNHILTGGRGGGGGSFSSRFGLAGRTGGGGGGAGTAAVGGGGGGTPAPVRLLGGASFLHLRAGDVHVLAVTRDNVNAMLAFSFMVKIVALMRTYFGGEFSEAAIRSNFVLVYELLDEVADHGWPQVTDANSLKQLVFQKGFVTQAARAKREAAAAAATLQVTGAVGWRRDGLKYKRNEVFLDVTEKVSALVGVGGVVLRADVNGIVTMKAFLSGMPDVKLGLNDAVEDVTFHQCVNLGRYDAERVASFVPPDGEFELMRYRCADAVALPFRLLPVVTEVGRTRLEVSLRLKATFDARLFATGVSVALPLPPTAAALDAVCSHGKAKYDPKKGALVWKIRRVAGGSEAALSGVVTCVATTRGSASTASSASASSSSASAGGSSSSRPPASLTFSVPMFSASGLRVQYLKVWEKSNYKVDKWVRKLCVSGDFSVRV